MTRIAQFDTQMLKDGYTITAAMIYGYLWWITWKTQIKREVSPSLWLMQKTLNIGRATIVRWINELEKSGLIEVSRRYKEKNTYLIIDMDNYPACCNYDEDKMVG